MTMRILMTAALLTVGIVAGASQMTEAQASPQLDEQLFSLHQPVPQSQTAKELAQVRQSGQLTAEEEHLNELLRQGQARVDSGDYAGAISYYRQAAQFDQGNAKIYSGIGYLQIQLGDFRSAAESYRQAIELDPRNTAFRYGLAHSLVSGESYQDAEAA